MSAAELVGRLAKVRNIMSKPEFNGSYVLIETYLSGAERYSVRTIPSPVGVNSTQKLAIKPENLVLYPQLRYYDLYPHAIQIHIDNFQNFVNELYQSTSEVLKLDFLQGSEDDVPNHVSIYSSRRIVGIAFDTLDEDGNLQPLTTLKSSVKVSPVDEDSIIEIENIRFSNIDAVIACTRGKHTTFRRCAFNTGGVVVGAGRDPLIARNPVLNVSDGTGTPNVVFENCHFEADNKHEVSWGVYIGLDGTVTLLNCTISNFGVGCVVKDGGQSSLIHCTIKKCTYGIQAAGKILRLDMTNCIITNISRHGIDMSMSGRVAMSGCKFEYCEDVGIMDRSDRKETRELSINGCHIVECGNGTCFLGSDVTAHVDATSICNNNRYGLFLGMTATGTVEVTRSTIEGNGENMSHTVGPRCAFFVDGVRIESTVSQFDPPSWPLPVRRSLHHAGLCNISCQNCGKIEEIEEEKFKKCGKCFNVCYCSRECQKAHWKEHKKDCKPSQSTNK